MVKGQLMIVQGRGSQVFKDKDRLWGNRFKTVTLLSNGSPGLKVKGRVTEQGIFLCTAYIGDGSTVNFVLPLSERREPLSYVSKTGMGPRGFVSCSGTFIIKK